MYASGGIVKPKCLLAWHLKFAFSRQINDLCDAADSLRLTSDAQ
jgi:hypothetical protein